MGIVPFYTIVHLDSICTSSFQKCFANKLFKSRVINLLQQMYEYVQQMHVMNIQTVVETVYSGTILIQVIFQLQ